MHSFGGGLRGLSDNVFRHKKCTFRNNGKNMPEAAVDEEKHSSIALATRVQLLARLTSNEGNLGKRGAYTVWYISLDISFRMR